MNSNKPLLNAQKEPVQFITSRTDIENEFQHYEGQFKGKVIYCPNDDKNSNYLKYFIDNFEYLGLRKIIASHYTSPYRGRYFTYSGKDAADNFKAKSFSCNDDKGWMSIKLLAESDIVVTTPFFNNFREFVSTVNEYKKKFLIMGNLNAATYTNVYPLIKENKLWFGATKNGCGKTVAVVPNNYTDSKTKMRMVDGSVKRSTLMSFPVWFTNMRHRVYPRKLMLTRAYNSKDYKEFDNYKAINVDRLADIPYDYKGGAIGVPLTILSHLNKNQFELLDCNEYRRSDEVKEKKSMLIKDADSGVCGVRKYPRVLVRLK